MPANSPISPSKLALGFALAVSMLGCETSVSPTNPYDPGSPADMQRAARLSGLILGLDSERGAEPLAGADVVLEQPGSFRERRQTTGPDGSFDLGEVLPGTYSLTVHHALHFRESRLLELGIGETRHVEISMLPIPQSEQTAGSGHVTGSILRSGELTLQAEEQDHSGILIEVADTGVRTVTNVAGRFDLFLSPGQYDLTATTRHYSAARIENVEVIAGETIEASADPIVLQPNPGTVAGHVRLEGSTESGHGEVLLSLLGGVTTTSAPDGSYRLTGVAPGTYTLRAIRSGFVTATIHGIVVDGGRETEIEEILLPIALNDVTGEVRLAGQYDHGGVTVGLTGTTHTALTNVVGAFALRSVPVGTYELTARKEGYVVGVVGSVEVIPESPTSVGLLTLSRRQGDFDVQGGPYTSSREVVLLLRNENAVSMRISEDRDFGDLGLGDIVWRDYDERPTFELSEGDGLKRIYVSYLDNLGVESGPFEGTVSLDTIPPEHASVTINGGAEYTRSPVVSLRLQAVDATSGLESMRISTDGVLDDEVFEPFVTEKTVTLAEADRDGEHHVLVVFRDRAGNESPPVGATIVLDRVPPTPLAFLIEQGAAHVGSPLVELTIEAAGATRMALSNDPGMPVEMYEPFVDSRVWFLNPGDGGKTVALRLMDEAGNKSNILTAQTILDTTPPSDLAAAVRGTIADGAHSTRLTGSVSVELFADATDDNGVVDMWIDGDVDPSPLTGSWIPFQPTTNLSLIGEDGLHTISVRVRDPAGNTAATSATITLDTTAPTGASVRIAQGEWTALTFVDLELDARDATEMWIEGDVAAAANTDRWIPFHSSQRVSLSGGDGQKTIRVRYRDLAGNETAQVTATTTLDTLPPSNPSLTIEGLVADDAASTSLTRTSSVYLFPSASGAAEMRLSNEAGLAGAPWRPFDSGPVPWLLKPGDGQKTVFVRFRDLAGNETSTFSSSILLDTSAPANPWVAIPGFDTHVSERIITVNLGATDATQMRVAVGEEPSLSSWTAIASSASVDLGTDDGSKIISADFRDAAGNVSAVARTTVVLDTVAPEPGTVPVRIEGGAAFTRSPSVTVDFDMDAAHEMRVGADGALHAKPWIAFAQTAVVLLPGGDCEPASPGCKAVCAEFRDRAGNVSGPHCATITLDTTPPSTPMLTTSSKIVGPNTTSILVEIAAPVQESFFDRYEVSSQPTHSNFTSVSSDQQQTAFVVPIQSGDLSVGGVMLNTIRIRAVDSAGNVSGESSIIITEDSVPPAKPSLRPPASTVVNADAVSIYFAANHSSHEDPTFSHYETKVQHGYADCTETGFGPTALRDGLVFVLEQGDGTACAGMVPCPNRLCVRAVDGAGNKSGIADLLVLEDSIPPTPPELYPRNAVVNAYTVAIRLLVPATDTSDLTYEIRGGQYVGYTEVAEQDLFEFALRPDQANELCVRARDAAGNVSVEDCVTITERSTKPVTQSPLDEENPDIFGDLVVYNVKEWCENDLRFVNEVYLHDLQTGSRELLSEPCGDDANHPRIAGNRNRVVVAWEEGGDIFVFVRELDGSGDSITNRTLGLPSVSGNSARPDAGTTYLAFTAGGEVYSIGVDGTNFGQVSSGASVCPGTGPRRDGLRVLWCDLRSGTSQVYLGHTGSWTEELLTEEPGEHRDPVISGTHQAWLSNGVIHFERFSPYSIPPTSTHVSADSLTGIWGGWVVFNRNVGGTQDIFLLKLEDSAPPIRLTREATNQVAASIHRSRVVWQDWRNLNYDIYHLDFSESKWVAPHPLEQTSPKVAANHVVWEDMRTGMPGGVSFNLSTGAEDFLPHSEGRLLAASEDWYLWATQLGPRTIIEARNFSGTITHVLTENAAPDPAGDLSSNGLSAVYQVLDSGKNRRLESAFWGGSGQLQIESLPGPPGDQNQPTMGSTNLTVWENGGQLHCYNTSELRGGPIPGTEGAIHPRLSYSTLVWEKDGDIYGCQLSCQTSTPSCATILPITSTPAVERRPDIASVSGQPYIVWESDLRRPGYFDIYLAPWSTADAILLTGDVDPSINQVHPRIHGRNVVWEDRRSGSPSTFIHPIVTP